MVLYEIISIESIIGKKYYLTTLRYLHDVYLEKVIKFRRTNALNLGSLIITLRNSLSPPFIFFASLDFICVQYTN